MNQNEKLIVRSPRRKQFGGLWILFCAVGAFVMWDNGLKGSGSEILLGAAIVLTLLGLYRCLTYSITVFQPGKIPTGKQLKVHFGILKKEQTIDFDELDILRRDMFLPYCQLYAYSSKDYLKTKMSEEDIKAYEEGRIESPGFVVIDHSTKKECEKLIEKIWRYYGLWDETSVKTAE